MLCEIGEDWKPSNIEYKKDPEAYNILKLFRKQGWIKVIFNKTGYNNAKTMGRLILPFWFKKKSNTNPVNPDNFIITMDGAGAH